MHGMRGRERNERDADTAAKSQVQEQVRSRRWKFKLAGNFALVQPIGQQGLE